MANQYLSCDGPAEPHRNPTTSFLTATTLIYAIGAGITAAAGTRLALQLFLFKVLFTFASWYLFAIGLVPVFSFRWSLPPTLGCIPKQPNSPKTVATLPGGAAHGALTLCDVPFQVNFNSTGQSLSCLSLPQFADSNCQRFQAQALPTSLAVTEGILVSFFSSAY